MTPWRAFQPQDLDACLAVFDSNVPTYFLAHERKEFAEFLTRPHEAYFVLLKDEGVIGCGGVFWRTPTQAGLSWGMVAVTQHKQGHGQTLLMLRLQWLLQHRPNTETVDINTSQHSQGFFAHYGFEVTSTTPNGLGEGLDEINMRLHLPTHRAQLEARLRQALPAP